MSRWLAALCFATACRAASATSATPPTPTEPSVEPPVEPLCERAQGLWRASLEGELAGFGRARRFFISEEQARDAAADPAPMDVPAVAVEIMEDRGDVLIVTNWGASEPDPFVTRWWNRLSLQLYVRRTDLLPVLATHASVVFDDATGYMVAPGAELRCRDGTLRARVHGRELGLPEHSEIAATFEPAPMTNGSGGIRLSGEARVDGRVIDLSPALAWVQVLEIETDRYQITVSSPQMTLVARVDQTDPPVNVTHDRMPRTDTVRSHGSCEFRAGTRLFFPDRRFAGRVAHRFTMLDAFEIQEHPRGNLRCSTDLAPALGSLCFFRSELGCL